MNLHFALNSSLIKRIARTQLLVDADFARQFFRLRARLYTKKISSKQFWEQYKKLLLKSVSKDKQRVSDLLRKTDKEMKGQFAEEAQRKKELERKPLIDLSLPE